MRVNEYCVYLDEDRCARLEKSFGRNLSLACDGGMLCNASCIEDLLNGMYRANYLAEEYMWMLAFDAKCHLLGIFEIGHGSSDCVSVSPRELFVRACLIGANRFILAHNHPSGVVCPSDEDIALTKRVVDCAALMNIPLQDHIIVGREGFYSFYEGGYIPT